MQQASLSKIQEFTIGVNMEHRDHATKLAVHEASTNKSLESLAADMKSLCEGNKVLVDAIQENTTVVSRWIEQMEKQVQNQ